MYLDDIKKRFADDLFATECAGIEPVEASDGHSVCKTTIIRNHQNAMGGVMGGMVFTLCDFAFAVASNGLDEPYTMTLSSSISFLAQPKGKILTAEACRIKDGRHTCFYEVTVTDDTGIIIAKAFFNGYKLRYGKADEGKENKN
ncbi:MAG: PaaI family thioesterase [Eubacteriales bacterium]|nr:PaaI family thioesterase [Eubacteriales bacterium]